MQGVKIADVCHKRRETRKQDVKVATKSYLRLTELHLFPSSFLAKNECACIVLANLVFILLVPAYNSVNLGGFPERR